MCRKPMHSRRAKNRDRENLFGGVAATGDNLGVTVTRQTKRKPLKRAERGIGGTDSNLRVRFRTSSLTQKIKYFQANLEWTERGHPNRPSHGMVRFKLFLVRITTVKGRKDLQARRV